MYPLPQVVIAFCKTLGAGIQPLSVIIQPLKSRYFTKILESISRLYQGKY